MRHRHDLDAVGVASRGLRPRLRRHAECSAWTHRGFCFEDVAMKLLTSALIAGGVAVAAAGAYQLRPDWFRLQDSEAVARRASPATLNAPQSGDPSDAVPT